MAVMSCAENVYCMNIIDNFSGYVWSIPLCAKSNAFSAFQNWHKAVMVQSSNTLCIIISDNGELVLKPMSNWCQSLGINHQCTAPYTSVAEFCPEWESRTTPLDAPWEGLCNVTCLQHPWDLLGWILPNCSFSLTIDNILSALSDSSLSPAPNDNDDEPTWTQAMASNKCECLIAGCHNKLKSLEDLKVFILVPWSELPWGHCPLKGKLVCKRKWDDTGKVIWYKVQYIVKGFAQTYSTIKPLPPQSGLNLFTPFSILLHPLRALTGNYTNSTSRQLSCMVFYPKMKQCSWNNLKDLKLWVKRSGLCA